MTLTYNKLAGQATDRINASSDAVFGVAMTLLVLEIKVSEFEGPVTEEELIQSVLALTPKLLVYFLSFMTAGIFWVGQSAQFRHIEKSDRTLTWINLLFLLFVSTLPFSTAFLGDHINFRFPVFLYWLNLFLMGLELYLNWTYAHKHGLIAQETIETVYEPIKKRIVVAQTLYLAGSLLCFISPYISIGVIIAIQLNYVFGISSGVFFRKEHDWSR